MSTPTVQNAKTQFVTTHDGIKLAYRVIGPPLSTSSHPPLLFLHHFRGTIDSWDPLLVHTFTAQGRPVILFDNAGIGHSSGTVDDSIPAMAAHIIEFLSLLSIKEVDILGFSLGGVIAPLVYLNGPKGHVRKLVLAGTQPTAGPDMLPAMADPLVVSVAGASELPVETFLTLFFKKTPTSEAAGRAWWSRSHERSLSSSGEERIGYGLYIPLISFPSQTVSKKHPTTSHSKALLHTIPLIPFPPHPVLRRRLLTRNPSQYPKVISTEEQASKPSWPP
jgi:pimeloyl-ACP methyl ester carboxylesterase